MMKWKSVKIKTQILFGQISNQIFPNSFKFSMKKINFLTNNKKVNIKMKNKGQRVLIYQTKSLKYTNHTTSKLIDSSRKSKILKKLLRNSFSNRVKQHNFFLPISFQYNSL